MLMGHESERTDDTVKPSTRMHQLYDYQAAEAACQREPTLAGGDFRLADDWAVQVTHRMIGPADNRRHHTSRKLVHVPAVQSIQPTI